MSTLFIGMPVYNGERFIAEALDSLRAQSFADWTLVISDNQSTDNTQAICQEYCFRDTRIKYHRHSENRGAINNFRFLLERADSSYFMWAAADDTWEKSFVDVCFNGLNKYPQAGLAFTNIVNIDSLGRVVREYPSFKPFSHPNPYLSIASYVLVPEYLGKANLIYGIYRLDALLKKYMLDTLSSSETNNYGFDMAHNLGVLCRTRVFIDERELFNKRLVRHQDHHDDELRIIPDIPYVNGVPRNEDFLAYKRSILTASRGTQFEDFVALLMDYRYNLNQDVETILSEKKQVSLSYSSIWNQFKKLKVFLRSL